MIRLDLPWPPTVNTYWRRRGAQYFIAPQGKQYRAQVWAAVKARGWIAPLTGALQLNLLLMPPDERRRDLDNILKALLDALAKAGVYHDDSQVKRLYVEHLALTGGIVKVEVAPLVSHETVTRGYANGKVCKESGDRGRHAVDRRRLPVP